MLVKPGPYSIHVNDPTKRAIAHPCTCGYRKPPALRTEHRKNYWLDLQCCTGVEHTLELFSNQGYVEARWCECRDCSGP